jgi:Activator of Hsp90 ATPase homolog 1-like protein
METRNDSVRSLNINEQDYQGSIVAKVTPKEALDKISRVSEWWAKNFEGSSHKPNDIFTVRFGSGDRYQVKVSEITPDKKITWDVIDSYQGWVKNQTEWTGTKILWEISVQEDGTRIEMTHIGLAPTLECHDKCIQGWDYLLHRSLFGFLTVNKGLPV